MYENWKSACGITGTRNGLKQPQGITLRRLLTETHSVKEWFVHGACVGVDVEAHAMAREIGYKTEGFPSNIRSASMFTLDEVSHPRKDPLARNKDIVYSVSLLFVCPKGFTEELRSGTWHAYRIAKDRRIKRVIIWPDGTVKEE